MVGFLLVRLKHLCKERLKVKKLRKVKIKMPKQNNLEEIAKLKKEIKALEAQFRKFAPITAALNYYVGKKTKLKELESVRSSHESR